MRRKRDDGGIVGDDESAGLMPAGLIDQHDGVRVPHHMAGDFGEVLGLSIDAHDWMPPSMQGFSLTF
jgi:hypothetical protein